MQGSDQVNVRKPREKKAVVVIGMPSWDIAKPFHALAIVAGIAREAGIPVSIHDVNIEFYHQTAPDERKYWAEEHSDLWNSEKWSAEFYAKYKSWLSAYLDRILLEEEPLLVGFSVNMVTRAFSVAAARHLKSRRPDLPVMFGGVDCFPKEHNKRFLSPDQDRSCDIICQGEAEISLRKFLEEFAATRRWQTEIPGFAYYDGQRLVDTGDTELPTLKERQPTPAFDLFDLTRYTTPGALPFFLSRGCPYNCHFCSEKPNFKRFRARIAEDAVAELERVLPAAQALCPTPTVTLSDSNINADMRLLERFVDLLLERNIRINWGGQAHIHARVTTEFIDKLSRAGFVSVFWGIETGSQHVVDLMNKRYHQSDARRILRECSRQGIHQHVPIILGFPGETPEDVAETVQFILEVKELPHCYVHLPCHIVVRPNSLLHTNFADFGLTNNNYYDWWMADGTNSLPIRIARRFVARQAHGNPTLTMDDLVDTEEILQVKLDDPGTSADLFRLVQEIFRLAGDPVRFYAAVDDWAAQASRSACNAPRGVGDRAAISREVWEASDKDSPAGRRRLYQLILEALRALRQHCQRPASAP